MTIYRNGNIGVFWSTENPATLIRFANLITFGKEDYDPCFEPSAKWCKKAASAEHSTLEWVHIVVVSTARSDVASHIVRHTKGLPRHVVQSFRPDWTGAERPGHDALRLYAGSWTPKSLIDMARQRLCSKSMAQTRSWTQSLKDCLIMADDQLMKAIGEAMVPDCEYRGKCYNGGCNGAR